MPTEQELISRTPQPATRASLARQMRENGLTLGGTVLVHSSLSSLGWVAGGPVAVIQALLDCVGPQGTIVMPTHSGDLTDPADWRSPPVPADWVQILRNEMPAYDPQTHQLGTWVQWLNCSGRVANTFGGSYHPAKAGIFMLC